MSRTRVAVLKVITKELTVTAAAAEHGYSRQHLQRLLARYRTGGLGAVDPQSRRRTYSGLIATASWLKGSARMSRIRSGLTRKYSWTTTLRRPAIDGHGTSGCAALKSPGSAFTASPITARLRSTASYAIAPNSGDSRCSR